MPSPQPLLPQPSAVYSAPSSFPRCPVSHCPPHFKVPLSSKGEEVTVKESTKKPPLAGEEIITIY